jgi:hypothetical protein
LKLIPNLSLKLEMLTRWKEMLKISSHKFVKRLLKPFPKP